MATRFGAEWRTLLIADAPVRCRYGLRVLPDCSLAEAPPLDLLVVPGGLGARTHARENGAILDFVRAQHGFVASVCTGALILAAAGVLDGVRATTHHNALQLLREYPAIDVQGGVRFIMHDDRIATSEGVSAGIDLALALVERFCGADVAAAVAANMAWR
jgi:transcriptional regulator GlxA family with amidase domain